jgi:hypothetical protein
MLRELHLHRQRRACAHFSRLNSRVHRRSRGVPLRGTRRTAASRVLIDYGPARRMWEASHVYYDGARVGNVWPLRGFAGWRAFLDCIGTLGKFGTRREAEEALRAYFAGLDIEPW